MKWDIEKTLAEANDEYIEKEEVCTGCPKDIGECDFWKDCSRAYILGKRDLTKYIEKNNKQ